MNERMNGLALIVLFQTFTQYLTMGSAPLHSSQKSNTITQALLAGSRDDCIRYTAIHSGYFTVIKRNTQENRPNSAQTLSLLLDSHSGERARCVLSVVWGSGSGSVPYSSNDDRSITRSVSGWMVADPWRGRGENSRLC